MSSIGAASIQAASRSSASARALRCGGVLDAGGGAHGDQAAVAARDRDRGAQRQAAAERVAHEHRALARRGDLAQAALESVLAVIEQGAGIAFAEELRDRPPGVAPLHEARDEEQAIGGT